MGLNFELDRVEEYEWISLEDDEEIEFRTHPSIIPKIPELIVALGISFGSIAAVIYILTTGNGMEFFEDEPLLWLLPILMFFIGVGDAVWTYIQIKATFYVFTTDKFIRKTNVFRTTTRETPYNKVQHFDMNYRTIPERLLNIGVVSISTAGTGGTELVLRDVPNPKLATEVLADYT